MKSLPLYEPYGIVPVGCDPEARPMDFGDYLRVGPCYELLLDGSGVESSYASDDDAEFTFPRLDWLCNRCKAPFSVMLEVGKGEVSTDDNGEAAVIYDTELHVAFFSAEDEARFRLAWEGQP